MIWSRCSAPELIPGLFQMKNHRGGLRLEKALCVAARVLECNDSSRCLAVQSTAREELKFALHLPATGKERTLTGTRGTRRGWSSFGGNVGRQFQVFVDRAGQALRFLRLQSLSVFFLLLRVLRFSAAFFWQRFLSKRARLGGTRLARPGCCGSVARAEDAMVKRKGKVWGVAGGTVPPATPGTR